MSAKKIVHHAVAKSEYINYFIKAKEFYGTMQESFISGSWTSSTLAAIHAVICANDALTIFTKGIKCSSSRHEDAVTMLQGLTELENVKTYATHLLCVIKKKNAVEYEGRIFTQKEAEELSKHAERFFDWVKSILPKQ